MADNQNPQGAGQAPQQQTRQHGQPGQGQGGQQGQQQPMTVPDALKLATQHYQQGRLDQAFNVCQQITKARPKLADARNLLGVIQHARGDSAEAVKSLKKAIEINGNVAQYHSNLGEIERQRGNADKALYSLRRAIAIDANYAQAYNNIGIIYFDRSEFEEAVKNYQKAIELNSHYPEAHNNLGNALRALGRSEEALKHYEKALMLRENYPEAYNNMATVLREKDMREEAEHAYRKALQLKPNYPEAYNNLATMMIQDKKLDEALRVLGEALKVDDKNIPVLLNVARVQLEKNNFEAVEMALKIVLKEDPANAEAECVYGQLCHELDKYEESLKHFERAIQFNPKSSEAHNFYGIALKSMGRLEDARKQFERTLAINPRAFGAYSNLADLEKFDKKNKLLKTMEQLMGEAENPDTERYMALHFALGKAYDDAGEYAKAFKHFSQGAALKRRTLQYNEADTHKFFDDIMAAFPAEIFKNRPYDGNLTELPVFIIGMPRSGSTLTEQIVSSHPKAFGAGEIKTFSRSVGMLRSRFPNLPKYPALARAMSVEHYNMVAKFYLDYIGNLDADAIRVTDKMLSNYYFVGFLHLLFPKAKFINTMRNPADTCFSAYTKLFKDDMPHSYDLAEMGRYHKKYEQVMAHWKKVLPKGVLMEVRYEDVVTDLESQAKKIIDFCGLEWDPACANFHKSKRPVKTASVVQVRKPVYKTSVERYKHYQKHLKPLLNALK